MVGVSLDTYEIMYFFVRLDIFRCICLEDEYDGGNRHVSTFDTVTPNTVYTVMITTIILLGSLDDYVSSPS